MCSSHVPSLNLFVIIQVQLISSTSEFIVNRARYLMFPFSHSHAQLLFPALLTQVLALASEVQVQTCSLQLPLLNQTRGFILISSTVTKMSCSILALHFTPHLQLVHDAFAHNLLSSHGSPTCRINSTHLSCYV